MFACPRKGLILAERRPVPLMLSDKRSAQAQVQVFIS